MQGLEPNDWIDFDSDVRSEHGIPLAFHPILEEFLASRDDRIISFKGSTINLSASFKTPNMVNAASGSSFAMGGVLSYPRMRTLKYSV